MTTPNDGATVVETTTVETGGKPGTESGANNAGPLFTADQVFAELPADSREWAVKQGYATAEGVSPATAAKLFKDAHEKEKLLGNAIRIPGKDATQEERDAYLNKLGRPEKVDGYEFKAPENLPAELPYDGEKATEFKGLAHSLGLTAAQAAGIHDWFVGSSVKEFEGGAEAAAGRQHERAVAETEKLVKRWGPLTGETAQANLQMGFKFLTEAGTPEVTEELKRVGLIGSDGKTILSEPLAVLFANAGMALYKEDNVLKGNPSVLGNPFEDGNNFNMSEQMRIVKEDRDTALSLIAAAGKKPSDFGLKT